MMIDPKELRIGNRIQFIGAADKWEVYYLTANTINDGSPEDYAPIPLSPAILEACGFELDSVTSYGKPVYHNPSFGLLDYYKGKVSLCLETGFSISKPLGFVHQLQNLHFVITGTELEIHLPGTKNL